MSRRYRVALGAAKSHAAMDRTIGTPGDEWLSLVTWLALGLEVALRDPAVGRELADEFRAAMGPRVAGWLVDTADKVILIDEVPA